MNSRRIETDVVVVGAGIAGVAASIAASRAGASVLLVERDGYEGGLASGSWVGTVCGAALCGTPKYESVLCGWCADFLNLLQSESQTAPMCTNDGLWFVPYDPLAFRLICHRELSKTSVRRLPHSVVFGAERDGDIIIQLSLLSFGAHVTARCKAVIDCSGEAIVSVALGLSTIQSDLYQSPSLVCRLVGISHNDELQFKNELLHDVLKGVRAAELPESLTRLSVVPGSLRDGRCLAKLSLPSQRTDSPIECSTLVSAATTTLDAFSRWLRQDHSYLSGVLVSEIAPNLGIRTGRRMMGLTQLTREDVLSCNQPADAIAQGTWPIEMWGSERTPTLSLLPPGKSYGISERTLRSQSVRNLFAAGRTLSADEDGIGSARVIGTAIQTGWSAGFIAAQ